jgi:hypothetical protein
MLPHAMLTVRNTAGEAVAIPVINFPILPEGSAVYLYLTDKVFFEGAALKEYSVDNKYGAQIDVDIAVGESPDSAELQDKDWNELAKLCVKDPNNNYPWIYPHTVDYGIKFPMPSK